MSAGPNVQVRNVRQVRASIDALDPTGGAACEVLFAHGSGTTGTTALVAAVTGKKIRVLSAWFCGAATNSITLDSASTALTPAIPCTTAGQYVTNLDFGLCQTAKSEALNAVPGGTGAYDITVAYILVQA